MEDIDKELRKHKFIAFVLDHYTPLGVIRSLGEKGIEPIVILISESPCMINHCRYVSKLHKVRTAEEGYEILMNLYGNEKEKPFVFCGDDFNMSFLDQHYNEIKDRFILYNAGEQGRIIWLQNKDNITSLASEVGLKCPQKEVVDKGVLPKTLNYPIITKVLASTMGAWKNDVFICNTVDELKEAYNHIKSPKLILQEYIKKKGEFCLEGFSINNGEDIVLPYVFDYIRFSNSSYGHYMTVTPLDDMVFLSQIEELLKKMRYNGIFEIEFMKGPNDERYFLEVNLRASTWNYAPTVGGCNLPYLWAKGMLTGRIAYDEITLRNTPFKAMVEPADFIRNVRKVGLVQWLKEWRSSECKYYYNRKDPKPFYYYVWNHILRREHSE